MKPVLKSLQESVVSIFLTSQSVSDVTLIARKQPWRQYSQHGNQQTPQIEPLFPLAGAGMQHTTACYPFHVCAIYGCVPPFILETGPCFLDYSS